MNRRAVVLTFAGVLGCAHLPPAPTAAQRTAAVEIATARAGTNAAIARRDAAGVVAAFLPTYAGTWAGGVAHYSRDSALTYMARAFADSALLGYVRTPTSIEVSRSGQSAAEFGRWTGRFQRADGVQVIAGSYYATWHPTSEGWRLNTETFVSLDCTGSTRCPRER